MSISRRTLIGKIGLLLPAVALLAATSARAADEVGAGDTPAATAPASHKHHGKKHASKAHKHKVAHRAGSATS